MHKLRAEKSENRLFLVARAAAEIGVHPCTLYRCLHGHTHNARLVRAYRDFVQRVVAEDTGGAAAVEGADSPASSPPPRSAAPSIKTQTNS